MINKKSFFVSNAWPNRSALNHIKINNVCISKLTTLTTTNTIGLGLGWLVLIVPFSVIAYYRCRGVVPDGSSGISGSSGSSGIGGISGIDPILIVVPPKGTLEVKDMYELLTNVRKMQLDLLNNILPNLVNNMPEMVQKLNLLGGSANKLVSYILQNHTLLKETIENTLNKFTTTAEQDELIDIYNKLLESNHKMLKLVKEINKTSIYLKQAINNSGLDMNNVSIDMLSHIFSSDSGQESIGLHYRKLIELFSELKSKPNLIMVMSRLLDCTTISELTLNNRIIDLPFQNYQ